MFGKIQMILMMKTAFQTTAYRDWINDKQGYDPYQMKKEKLAGDISKFPPVKWHSLL